MKQLRFLFLIPIFLVPGLCPAAPAGSYTGSGTCATCHQDETTAWHGSHHELAMQEASETSVLGDFSATVTFGGEPFTFSRSGDSFLVSQGDETYRVTHTFGVEPLQQYLVQFPQGRRQVLPVAWDTNDGRWFSPQGHMNPAEVPDWKGYLGNWNGMCAECHSTHLEKNYDFASDSYRTTFSEVNVACEACHGPAAGHLAWLAGTGDEASHRGFPHSLDRGTVHWLPDTGSGKPVRKGSATMQDEIRTCGACHSRRSQFFEDDRVGQPLLDSFLPAPVAPPLYHFDGQIDEEVYVYGSFLQSRMYQQGVTCSDCHDPHSLQLRQPGDAMCLSCHGPGYAGEKHHFHEPAQLQCVDCHMPATTYMGNDPRRDHSFRVPDPYLTGVTGAPNACNGCHEDRSPAWAEAVIGREMRNRHRPFALAMHAARTGQSSARSLLSAVIRDDDTPAVQRAAALRELGRMLVPADLPLVAELAGDDSALVRAALPDILRGAPQSIRRQVLAPLLSDETAVVRALAAGSLSDLPQDTSPMIQAGLERYEASLLFNADDPSARTNLGDYHASRAEPGAARAWYEAAIELEPDWITAYINLADLHRDRGEEDQGRALLLEAIERQPEAAVAHHSLGLAYIRQQQYSEALQSLERAARLDADNPRYLYVYAVALNDLGQRAQAVRELEAYLSVRGDAQLESLLGYLRTFEPGR